MDLHGLRQLAGGRRPIRQRVPSVNTRLCLLLFLLYTAPGAVVPLFSLRLKQLGFTPGEIGWCCATQAIGSLLAPLLAGQIADRWLAAEKCLAICSFLCAGLLWLIAGLATPAAVFGVSLLFWLLMAPALTLATATCFAHLRDARREFGWVRMWGTIGWVLPGWLFGFWLASGELFQPLLSQLRPERPAPELADVFRLASLAAVVFGFYALTLPHTPPRSGECAGAAPLAALRLLRGRAFFVYAFCTLGITIALPFSSQLTPLLLEERHIARPWIPRLLTLAQASEILSLFLLPVAMRRLGVRRTMCLGLAAAALTLGGLALGRPLAVVLAGLALYGLCVGCYLVAGQMFLNQRARPDVRASAQALHSVLCGIGLLIGNLLAGQIHMQVHGDFTTTFAVGTGLALALLLVFALLFPHQPAAEDERPLAGSHRSI